MDKKYLKEKIEEIKKSLSTAKDNKMRAENHIYEGELILKAFTSELEKFK